MSRISERLKEQVDEFINSPWLYVRLTVEFLFHENRKYQLKTWVWTVGEGAEDAEE